MSSSSRKWKKRLEGFAKAALPDSLIESNAFVAHWDAGVFAHPDQHPELLLQIAASMFMDKPIILMLPRGLLIPRRVKRVADHIIWVDVTDPDRGAALKRAFDEMTAYLAELHPPGKLGGVTLMDMNPAPPEGEKQE
jgi:hypothetical protein